jgi:two-component system response regulator MprA
VLLVDDDRALRDAVGRALRLDGYHVALAAEGREALFMLSSERVDVVVLDVSMPTVNGLEVCRRIRAAGDDASILMLTARDGIRDRVAGLDAGADDYLVKPFALGEFLARVRAGMRRALSEGTREFSPPSADLRFADLRMDSRGREVSRAGRQLNLTKTEYALLELFMASPGTVLSRPVILDRIWPGDRTASSKVVDVFVSHLRKKMEAAGERRLLETVHCVGYVLRENP